MNCAHCPALDRTQPHGFTMHWCHYHQSPVTDGGSCDDSAARWAVYGVVMRGLEGLNERVEG